MFSVQNSLKTLAGIYPAHSLPVMCSFSFRVYPLVGFSVLFSSRCDVTRIAFSLLSCRRSRDPLYFLAVYIVL